MLSFVALRDSEAGLADGVSCQLRGPMPKHQLVDRRVEVFGRDGVLRINLLHELQGDGMTAVWITVDLVGRRAVQATDGSVAIGHLHEHALEAPDVELAPIALPDGVHDNDLVASARSLQYRVLVTEKRLDLVPVRYSVGSACAEKVVLHQLYVVAHETRHDATLLRVIRAPGVLPLALEMQVRHLLVLRKLGGGAEQPVVVTRVVVVDVISHEAFTGYGVVCQGLRTKLAPHLLLELNVSHPHLRILDAEGVYDPEVCCILCGSPGEALHQPARGAHHAVLRVERVRRRIPMATGPIDGKLHLERLQSSLRLRSDQAVARVHAAVQQDVLRVDLVIVVHDELPEGARPFRSVAHRAVCLALLESIASVLVALRGVIHLPHDDAA
mmetsp:Transcript_69140/g.192463  ORF Transcript_69140/g.192463 Transcript_69140/m.192463 type:complete len:385 (-) Transcript_69140:980-2134(-)